MTPAGLRLRSCVHTIEDGARFDVRGAVHRADGSTYLIPACAEAAPPRRHVKSLLPDDDGWVEAALSNAPTGQVFSNISAAWTVPAAPTGSYGAGQVFYTFPGLQDSVYVLQTVLQYGANAFYGGNYWTITSWYCGPTCLYSTPVRVSVGDQLTGQVSSSSCGTVTCLWTMSTLDITASTHTNLTWTDTNNYTQVVGGAIEVYGLTSCNQFPDSAISYGLDNIEYYGGTLATFNWFAYYDSDNDPACSFSVDPDSAFFINLWLPKIILHEN